MIRTLTLALCLGAAACGGKDKGTQGPGTTAAAGSGAEHSHVGEDHHAGMTSEMTAFHDQLRPLWHAERNTEWPGTVCAALPQLDQAADAIAKAVPPPAANADTWTAGTRALVDALAEMSNCKERNFDAKAFEASFKKVHDAFHSLMAAAQTQGKGGGDSKGGHHKPGGGDHEHEPGADHEHKH